MRRVLPALLLLLVFAAASRASGGGELACRLLPVPLQHPVSLGGGVVAGVRGGVLEVYQCRGGSWERAAAVPVGGSVVGLGSPEPGVVVAVTGSGRVVVADLSKGSVRVVETGLPGVDTACVSGGLVYLHRCSGGVCEAWALDPYNTSWAYFGPRPVKAGNIVVAGSQPVLSLRCGRWYTAMLVDPGPPPDPRGYMYAGLVAGNDTVSVAVYVPSANYTYTVPVTGPVTVLPLPRSYGEVAVYAEAREGLWGLVYRGPPVQAVFNASQATPSPPPPSPPARLLVLVEGYRVVAAAPAPGAEEVVAASPTAAAVWGSGVLRVYSVSSSPPGLSETAMLPAEGGGAGSACCGIVAYASPDGLLVVVDASAGRLLSARALPGAPARLQVACSGVYVEAAGTVHYAPLTPGSPLRTVASGELGSTVDPCSAGTPVAVAGGVVVEPPGSPLDTMPLLRVCAASRGGPVQGARVYVDGLPSASTGRDGCTPPLPAAPGTHEVRVEPPPGSGLRPAAAEAESPGRLVVRLASSAEPVRLVFPEPLRSPVRVEAPGIGSWTAGRGARALTVVLPPGTHVLHVSDTGKPPAYMETNVTVTVPGPGEVEVPLKHILYRVVLNVTGADTGEPVDCRVCVEGLDCFNTTALMLPLGSYRARVEPLPTLPNTSLPAYKPAELELEAPAQQPVQLRLERAWVLLTLRLRDRDTGGPPEENLTVKLPGRQLSCRQECTAPAPAGEVRIVVEGGRLYEKTAKTVRAETDTAIDIAVARRRWRVRFVLHSPPRIPGDAELTLKLLPGGPTIPVRIKDGEAEVTLPAGTYKVVRAECRYGRVEAPRAISVTTGRTIELILVPHPKTILATYTIPAASAASIIVGFLILKRTARYHSSQ